MRRPGKLREPRSGERHRQLPLHGSVDGADQRLQLGFGQELDLVEQEHHAPGALRCGVADRLEHVGEIVVEVPGVGLAGLRLDVQAGGQRPIRLHCEGERLQDRGCTAGAFAPACSWGRLEERTTCEVRHLGAERRALGDVCVNRDPVLLRSDLLVLAEQHRLADSTQSGDDQGLLRIASTQALQEHSEVFDLCAAAGEISRRRPCVRGVWIPGAIHGLTSFPSLIHLR
jgi:hypothetical protein